MTENLEALKWTMQINVEGMSLWMHRGTHIDVLFADDKLGASWKHHFVTLHPHSGDDVSLDIPTLGMPLQGVTLDFTRLNTQPTATQTQAPFGMLPMSIEPGSPATKPDAVVTGEGLVAGLRLPLGVVSSLGHEKGPFSFAGDECLYLGFGVRWIGTMIGTQNIVPRVITHGTGATYDFEVFGQNKPFVDRELTIRSLSYEDRTTSGGMAYGDHLTEVAFQGHIACASKKPLASVPVFHGNKPGSMVPKARPQRPCPAGWGT